MPHKNKVEYLVVDTSAFIKNAPLQDYGTNIYTVRAVVNEVTSKRQLRNLVVLPYDLQVKDVFPENVKYITEFSKKTGDFSSLSSTDIQVMALTLQLEKEKVGIDHLREMPEVHRLISSSPYSATNDKLAGFYLPPPKEKTDNISAEEESKSTIKYEKDVPEVNELNVPEQEKKSTTHEQELTNLGQKVPEVVRKDFLSETELEEQRSLRVLQEDLQKTQIRDEETVDRISQEDEEEAEESSDYVYSSDEEDDIWNDQNWITPCNIDEVKQQQHGDVDETTFLVGCITTDFAMQNVLRQLGLHVLALDGKEIRNIRTCILRCYSCFKTTSRMELLFCPRCGNKTLKRVGVSLLEDGTQIIHINTRRPLTGRGRRFSLPKPQGGKHANNPLLVADQRLPQQRSSRLARTKNDPLDPDYTAGFSPFIMRDVNSKSAMLGIRSGEVKNWMRANPNAAHKKGKKGKRK